MDKKAVSLAVVRRLPRYYRYINDLYVDGVERISSTALAEQMGFTASQIRQDLNCFGGFGQQGYGYNVETLRSELASILNIDKNYCAIVAGIGNLGRALLQNFNFIRSGVQVKAAFDADLRVVGTEVNGLTVRYIGDLEDFLRAHPQPIDIGIITVPKSVAYDVAKTFCDNGVRALLNFTSYDLSRAGITVPVENVHFTDSLLTLTYRIE